uniref:Uncharacterized protein n=1 Tax=Molossus molossus TaxID=27622 RepID=A0A7J8CS97_MOLMO|nr:hypothetical protein HJG59_009803 [Molossus molossus]
MEAWEVPWGLRGGHRMWPSRCVLRHPLCVVRLGPVPSPSPGKDPKGPPGQWPMFALARGIGVSFRNRPYIREKPSRIRRHQLSIGSEWHLGDAKHLQRRLQVAPGAPQGGLPSAPMHVDSVKQWVPVCFHHMPVRSFVRCVPSMCLSSHLKPVFTYFCTNMLGTL